MGSPSWPRPGVEGELADRGLVAEPAEVRPQVLRLRRRAARGRPRGGRCRSPSRTRGRPGRARRRPAGSDDDGAEHQAEVVGSSARPDGRAHAAAAERRALREPRAAAAARWFVGVRPRRRPSSISRGEAEARAARVEEGERVGRRRRAPVVELELEALVVVLAVVPFAHLVLAPAVRPCDGWTGGACSSGLLLPQVLAARHVRPARPWIRSATS